MAIVLVNSMHKCIITFLSDFKRRAVSLQLLSLLVLLLIMTVIHTIIIIIKRRLRVKGLCYEALSY